ncbi:hypothetical protein CPC08DRAFT_454100 [Agrocybe pediades]|nr:hypothetical protein CPC08DRAFT_454100 [Agrocybe pediades]
MGFPSSQSAWGAPPNDQVKMRTISSLGTGATLSVCLFLYCSVLLQSSPSQRARLDPPCQPKHKHGKSAQHTSGVQIRICEQVWKGWIDEFVQYSAQRTGRRKLDGE